MRNLLLLMVLLPALLFSSGAVYGQAVTGITIKAPDTTLEVGESSKYSFTIKPDNAQDQSVTWSSSDRHVVDVDSAGFITALKEGTSTIQVKTEDGAYKASVKVTVREKEIDVRSISFKEYKRTLYSTELYAVKYTIYPTDATNQKVSWKTSNAAIATVSNGLITAKTPGTCKIIGTTEDGLYDQTLVLQIIPLPANPFVDIDQSSYRSNILILAKMGFVSGYESKYRPAETMSRAELATLLSQSFALKSTSSSQMFKDLDPSSWYYNSIAAAVNNHLLSGYPDGTFRPMSPVTLEEAVAIVTRLHASEFDLSSTKPSSAKFTCSDWARTYVDYAANNGLVELSRISKFNRKAVRDEIAYIIYNALKKSDSISYN